MFCKQCGKEILGESLYCNHCGAKIDETVNDSNNENQTIETIENKKEDKKEKHSKKKRFNLKIAIGGLAVLAVIGVGIALFLFYHSSTSISGNTNNNIINDGIAVIDKNDWIYYSNGLGKMYKMKNDGGQESVILDEDNCGDRGYVNYEYMNVIGDWIYYVEDRTYASSTPTNYKYRLYKIKTDGSNLTLLDETEKRGYSDLTVVGNWIYYIGYDSKDYKDYNIYKMKTDGSNRTKLLSSEDSGQIENLNVVGDCIYYREWITSTKQTTIYKAKIDGSNKKGILSSTKGDFSFLKVYGDWIYYVSESKIYKVKTDGSGKIGVSNGEVTNCGEFNVVGDWIYYEGSNGKESDSLYKMKTDGGNNTKITTGNECYIQLNVVGDWIFYSGRSIHYKVKIDGTMNSKIMKD